jgi:nucleotide-binding universal stress UspA family protein
VGEFYDTLCAEAEDQLQQLVNKYPHNGGEIERTVHQGVMPECILDFAQTQKADLIVMGTHGRRGFDRLLLGSVTEGVMRKASCPVLTVNKTSHEFIHSDKQPGILHLNKILFCTDFSEYSQKAFDHAMSLAAEYKAELTLLHVLEDIPDPAKIPEATETARGQLDHLIPAEELDMDNIRIRTAARIGKAYQQIIEVASEAPMDLIIMAVRGRGTLDFAVFGSTTHRVVQFGPCPVLIVHD